ncbi:P-loop containing nucleoside triphosphate hydrolase protein [Neocallimastix sp. 'constans']|jgi:myosin-7
MATSDSFIEVEDMTTLSELSESAILQNLEHRYKNQKIYTYTGSILVAMNPFKLINIYSGEKVKEYHSARIHELPPHIFAIAECAYSNVCNESEDQAVIISGESGAGKSESTKYILQYLTAVTTTQDASNQSWIEQQILESNTVLESFGNAKTVRNNNSSRFGKFIQVLFKDTHQIIGANIINYLLEKSRIVQQAPSERNYHVFYELLDGATPEEREKYLLDDPENFHYLNQSGCVSLDGVSDKENFRNLKLAFSVLKMNDNQIEGTFKIISGILHLGNVKFTENTSNEGADIDGEDEIDNVVKLLSCDKEKLKSALLNKKLVIAREVTISPLKFSQVFDNRDSIAKILYDFLFDKLLEIINKSLTASQKASNFVGVLDIFGFEVFENNSFEQLCINYTNEKLQQFFNHFIFKLEQQEYDKENIKWDKISFVDNQNTLELIEGKLGVYSLLDDETRFPKGSDNGFLDKINDKLGKHESFFKPPKKRDVFGIKHYAGEVVYNVKGFLDKNKDSVQDDIYELFSNSTNDFIKEIFKKKWELKQSLGKKMPTAGAQFKNQLTSLVKTLGQTTPHYVRCIKPNHEKTAFGYNLDLVTAQLRYSGMLDTIRIRKAGYPMRITFDEFVKKYRCIAVLECTNDNKENSILIVKKTGISDAEWQTGSTKIFLKQDAYSKVQDLYQQIIAEKIICIQKVVRGYLYHKKYMKMKSAAEVLNRNIKMYIYKEKYKKQKEAIVKIQAVVRGWFVRSYYKQLKKKQEEAERKQKQPDVQENDKIKEKKEEELKNLQMKIQKHESKKLNNKATTAKKTPIITDESAPTSPKKPGGVDDLFSFLDAFEGDIKDINAASKADAVINNMFDDLDNLFNEVFEEDKKEKEKKEKAVTIGEEHVVMPEELKNLAQPEPEPEKVEPEEVEFNYQVPKIPLWAMQEEEKVEIDYYSEEYSMQTYAEKNFEIQSKNVGTFRGKSIKMEWNEMLSYTKYPISISITQFSKGYERYAALSLELFKLLQKILENNQKKVDETLSAIITIIHTGIENPDIRDEILVQICKQVTAPEKPPKNWNDILFNGWVFLALVANTFTPSKSFSKYFNGFIKRAIKDNENATDETKKAIHYYASLIESNYKALNMNGCKKYPPSVFEIFMIRNKQKITFEVNLLNKTKNSVELTSTSVSSDVIKEILKMNGIKDINGWSLYYTSHQDNVQKFIKSSEYISDIIAEWESLNKNENSNIYNELKMNPNFTQNKNALNQLYCCKVILKKRLFRNPKENITNLAEHELIICQALENIKHDWYNIPLTSNQQIIALKAQQLYGDYSPENMRKIIIEDYLSSFTISKLSSSEWEEAIAKNYQKLIGKSNMEANVLLFEAIKQLENYGSTVFNVKYKGFWSYSENIQLSISNCKVDFIIPKTKNAFMSFKYNDIQNWEVPEKNVITLKIISKDKTDEDISDDKDKLDIYSFLSPNSEEIATLLKDYSLKQTDRKNKDKGDLNIDIGVLKKDVDKAKAALLEKKLLRLPGPDSISRNKASTLMRGTIAMTMNMKPKPNLNISPNGYSDCDWDYSKYRISNSITNISASDDDQKAVTIHSSLLIYAGIVSAVNPNDKPNKIIQNVIQTAMESPVLCDEIYMQLIKLTSNCPDPNSKAVLSFWEFLYIIIGIVLPPTPEILNYLKAHLRLYRVIDNKSKRKRTEENERAKKCYKELLKPRNIPRVYPPSNNEINAMRRLTFPRIRVYFMDGTFKAVMVEPSMTVQDICKNLKQRPELKNINGFTLFETYGHNERKMENNEKIGDLLYKWENEFENTDAIANNDLRIVFKKHLFINAMKPSDNYYEETLIKFQILEEVIKEKYPLTSSEAAFLMALETQFEYGDYKENGNVNFKEIMQKIVPSSLWSAEICEIAKLEYKKLSGLVGEDLDAVFMFFLRSWELFGSSIFKITQNFTDELPIRCWLAINDKGIHLLSCNSRVPIVSHDFESITSCSPSQNSIMIVIDSVEKSKKYVLNTIEANIIANIIQEFIECTKNSEDKS